MVVGLIIWGGCRIEVIWVDIVEIVLGFILGVFFFWIWIDVGICFIVDSYRNIIYECLKFYLRC